MEDLDKCVVFGPMSWWRSFLFGLRLHRAGLWHRVCKNPRAVAVLRSDIDQAGKIWEGVFGDQGDSTRGV